ncbi:MAG: amino acid adenylation domain-containing protein, partial [Chloroflexi bacterium]|nr:amino acid adenylation domain-containing protein [Chloroflexota bacterium]
GRLARHYEVLLAGAAANPDQPIARLPLLSQAECHLLLHSWNNHPAPYPAAGGIHQLVERQAARQPEAVAVATLESSLTYAALEQRANQLAHYLQAQGVGPERRVGLALERSPELVVAVLGVLKAGGAYVPLDPTYPPARLAFMAQDAGLTLLLADGRSPHDWQRLAPGVRVILLEEAAGAIAHQSPSPPASNLAADNLAYVIYTSGSTGQPKGVLVSHRGLLNVAAAEERRLGLRPADRILQFSSLNFDASMFEMLMAWQVGAALCLGEREQLLPGPNLAGYLAQMGVTVVALTPSTLAALPERALPALRLVIAGGEACPAELVHRWGRGRRFYNVYGPTEATIWATAAECRPEESVPPVGSPIDNVELYILDDHLQPLPVGVVGELCLGGVGLARGYLNQPGLTAERFVPHPFSRQPGQRLYRTGDRARYRADGQVEFLGRLDGQVKLRGYRIELGEIEAALAAHEAVAGCAVVPRQDRPGEKRLVAYLVLAEGAAAPPLESWPAYLRQRLPAYMVPAAFVLLDRLPTSPNGKLDYRALPPPELYPEPTHQATPPGTQLEQVVAAIWSRVLGVEKVGIHDNFFDLGGHSLLLAQVHSQVQEAVGVPLPLLDLFQYPTVDSLARRLAEGQESQPAALEQGHTLAQARRASIKQRTQDRSKREYRGSEVSVSNSEDNLYDIAIIGLAGRFPGARDVEAFWQNLRNGLESISFFSDDELIAAGVDPTLLGNPNYVKAAGSLEDVALFDAAFFGFSPREAELMDPQQRFFLEGAWEALEAAGYDPARHTGRIGVFAGVSTNTYLFHNLLPNRELIESVGAYQTMLSNDKDFLATRVSYKLGLTGPSLTIQTACSTSLVAVHYACQSLLNHECHMALAGGVSISVPTKSGQLYQPGGISSPDGHCRAFDAQARGTVGGNGMGIVVLKRLADARRDGDVIHAVIKGSAVNNDGAAKVGYTAPSVEGQAQVIVEAMAMADVRPETIAYVEAHGTGTELGDPIEVAALTRAFRTGTDKNGFCAIGSVKTNIGHLDAAAGVAGLIKVVLALKHQELPPSLHFTAPNPQIDFAGSPFYVNDKLRSWPGAAQPRRAGVSSFGIGGTNAHVIVEEAPARQATTTGDWQLLPLSARDEATLDRVAARLAGEFERQPELPLADVAYTLQMGRRAFAQRRAVVCRDVSEARRLLAARGPTPGFANSGQAAGHPAVAFMFPGQGTQYVNMGRELYQREPVFREHVDRCAHLLRPLLGLELPTLLYPEFAQEAEGDKVGHQLNQTAFTQPALFTVCYGLAQLWMAWGIHPQAMIGHSIGEYVAACLAGVLSLEDALKVVAARGRFMQQMAPGAMLAVLLPEEQTMAQLAGNSLALAAVNGADQCVVAGTMEEVEVLARALEEQGVACRRLPTSHAFHSAMMEPAMALFEAEVQTVALNPPQIPYLSNVTGTWITPAEATDPAYWVRQLRQPVRFADGARLLAGERRIFLEVGPGQSLGRGVQSVLAGPEAPLVLGTLPGQREAGTASEQALILNSLGRLWSAGAPVEWQGLHAGKPRQRVTLPTYPFAREPYWIEPGGRSKVIGERRPALPAGEREVSQWFYLPAWRRTLPPHSSPNGQPRRWLLWCDEQGLGEQLALRLTGDGHNVFTVKAGRQFARDGDYAYTINPRQPADYEALVRQLPETPLAMVHLWSLTSAESDHPAQAFLEWCQERGYYSLLYLAQALEKQNRTGKLAITVVSNHLCQVVANETVHPEKATLLGPCKVIPQEYANLTCRYIDVSWPATRAEPAARLIDQLVTEILAPTSEAVVAY